VTSAVACVLAAFAITWSTEDWAAKSAVVSSCS
jgi:hypothetical protein